MQVAIQRINERLKSSLNESDTAYFFDLMLAGEQLTKITTGGLVACLTDDSKRHRYSQIYRLIRADGIGEWSSVIDEVLSGPSSHFFNPIVNNVQRELAERLTSETWQYKSVKLLHACIKIIDSSYEGLPTKIAGKAWFSYFAFLRNKTRGHGAYSSSTYSKICPLLLESLSIFTENFSLINQMEWAYLNRNLSGKYKVLDISLNASSFHYLRIDRNPNFENGVYLFINKPIKVELIYSNSDLFDIFFANGGFNNNRFEAISYITGNKEYHEASRFLSPPGNLPSSETEGIGKLELVKNVFTNIPSTIQTYVNRLELEAELKRKLIDDRHPIVTLTGRGGVGKTSLALTVLNEMCNESRFSAIIWFSARDIDLLMEGAKPVKPHVLTAEDIAKEYVRLLEPKESKDKGFKPRAFIESEFGSSTVGPVLYIFDNFETVKDPIDLFQWLDTYIRNPNKILITSRFREFKADYPIEVGGMNLEEFKILVDKTSKNLGITELVNNQQYLEELYNESDGHPYVIKVLLGEVAKEGKVGKIKRIVASKDEILTALFERTYNGISPAAKRIFLTLSNWRSTIPEIAIEAVLMRESNEYMDVEAAIEELNRSSLINIEKSEKDGMRFISSPLSASVFGKKKLSVSPMKTAIEADTQLLHTFGVGLNTEIHLGIEPRIIKFFRDIAKRVSTKADKLENYISILEFICRKYPSAWITLSFLYEEEHQIPSAINALQNYLEGATEESQKLKYWERLSELYRRNNDWYGELHALIEMCELPNTQIEIISQNVYGINFLISSKKLEIDSTEKEILVKRIIKVFSTKLDKNKGDASDFSQLAWLYLSIKDVRNAKEAVQRGLIIESDNHHCLKLKETLSMN